MCVCPQGGRVSASVHAGMPYPPRPGRHPPRTRQTPRDQADPPRTRQTPPGPGRPPPGPGRPPVPGRTPPDQTDPPGPGRTPGTRQTPPGPGRPPRKQTPAYGLRAAGTHPTGMHSCQYSALIACVSINSLSFSGYSSCQKILRHGCRDE